ncbi:chromosome segregation SMC family protein [Novosphingobium tardum]|uniref:Chromosome partition protein Smc n=1 Tax=Novosphingobium tardum TaxID=1538021 RepID=A0ABV8RS65_9SPHN
MQFEKLRLSGFKSFVEPAELRIERGLTGVVGPNGCGKSNLLEAIRWVMGESSPKSLRGGGMEDVIFAGTGTRPARDFAEVVLTARGSLADNDSDRELEVTRRIERGAGSAYRINGRDVRAKDVALVFADAATGAHSPALVSQGRIAAVIAAKPAERRQMLEEAAGIAGLHVRRRDAEAKLRATEANLLRLEDLLAGLSTQIAALRRQARAAERYRQISDKVKVAEARLVFARWVEAEDAARLARIEAEGAAAAVATAQRQAELAQNAQHTVAAAAALARDELADRRQDAAAHGHRMATLGSQLEAAEQRLVDLDRQIARIDEDAGDAGRLTSDAAEAMNRLERDALEAEQALETEEARRPSLLAAQENAERAARAAELALAQGQAEQAGIDADWRIADAALASAATRLDRTRAELARRKAEADARRRETDPATLLAAADEALQASSAEREAAQAARDGLAEARARLSSARDAASEDLARARADCASLEREADALDRERKARERKASGKLAIDGVRAAPGYERALAAVLGRDARSALGVPAAALEGRFWTGAPTPASLPDSLAHHVSTMPHELAARLALVRFREVDDGEVLRPGEWLVTRAGELRRWDGFVVRGEGAASAAELEAANRLASIEQALPALRTARDAAELGAAETNNALQSHQSQLAAAEQKLARAIEAERAAVRARDQAEAAVDRHAARSAEIERMLGDLAEQEAAALAEHREAQSRREGLPDPAVGREAVEQARRRHDDARQSLQLALAASASLEQGLAALRERRATLRGDIRSWQGRVGDAERRMADMAKRRDELVAERAVIAAKPAGLIRDIEEGEAIRERLGAELAAAEAVLATHEAATKEAAATLAAVAEALSTAREARAGAAARAENQEARREEMARISGERFQCPPPLLPPRLGFATEDVGTATDESAAMDRLVAERERIGPVNLVAAEELAEAEARHGESAAEQAELGEAVNRLRGSIGNLNREGRERLRAAFEAVDGHFRRLFTRLFDGGQAHLALVDSDDPLEAGLEIFAQPPGKRLQSLTLLSGGEQALTAIALIFALFLTNPAPICVLDEVDAPLDDANIERFCDLLDAMVSETATRYLIVTHNAVTMSRMHRLFGVTMVEQGVSRLVSVDLGGAEALLAAE